MRVNRRTKEGHAFCLVSHVVGQFTKDASAGWRSAARALLGVTPLACVMVGCLGTVTGNPPEPSPEDPAPDFKPHPHQLHRLTNTQYRNSLLHLLPEGVEVSSDLPADLNVFGSLSIGASINAISPYALERYETIAFDVSQQAVSDADRRLALVGCAPQASIEDACLLGWIERFGSLAWRRPLSDDEVQVLAQSVVDHGAALGDLWKGVQMTLYALFMAPDFLYRFEQGEPDPQDATVYRYTSIEMASRLSYALWASTPDQELLDAGISGALSTPEGIREHATRMLESPKAKAALEYLAREWLYLNTLEPDVAPDLAWAMRAELQTVLSSHVIAKHNFMQLFSTRQSYVNAALATHYDLEPAPEAWSLFARTFAEDSGRAGILGRAGVLANFARGLETSPTLRGRFVQEGLLCNPIPEPPPDVDTDLEPAPDGTPLSTRERLEEHRTNDSCRGCHEAMDPYGFTLEHFDSLGRYRDNEPNGASIDANVDIDGETIDGAEALGRFLETNARAEECVVRRVYRFATGHMETKEENVVIQALLESFRNSGARLDALLIDLVSSPGFRFASPEGTP